MYHLKLIKGKSYWGVVRASEDKPDVYVSDKEQAEKLINSGYFEMVSGELTFPDEDSGKAQEGEKDKDDSGVLHDEEPEDEGQENPVIAELQTKTKAELIEYATKNGIDITGCKTKDDIFSKIIEAIARADAARAALREE